MDRKFCRIPIRYFFGSFIAAFKILFVSPSFDKKNDAQLNDAQHNDAQLNDAQHNIETQTNSTLNSVMLNVIKQCHSFIVMLSVVILNVIMLSVFCA